MALADTIKQRMFAAMKAQDSVQKEILRVALGEIQSAEARSGKAGSDEDTHKILRKLVKSNRETLEVAEDATQRQALLREIEILESLLPKVMSLDEVVNALGPVRAAIVSAGNDGQATGIAFKHLKSLSGTVDGGTVSGAVKRIRSESD